MHPSVHRVSLLAALVALAIAPVAAAQQADELDEIFGGLGTAEVVEEANPDTGSVVGRVFDGASGAPLAGASVILKGAAPADGGDAFQQVQVTAIDGSYGFEPVPPGGYELTFIKAGYRASTMTGVEVAAGEDAVEAAVAQGQGEEEEEGEEAAEGGEQQPQIGTVVKHESNEQNDEEQDGQQDEKLKEEPEKTEAGSDDGSIEYGIGSGSSSEGGEGTALGQPTEQLKPKRGQKRCPKCSMILKPSAR